jgi:hypothetical protein
MYNLDIKKSFPTLLTISLIVPLILCACAADQPGNQSTPSPNPLSPQLSATHSVQITGTESQTEIVPAMIEGSSGSLWIRLFASDGLVVTDPNFILTGQAPANTVISINDEILVVDKSEQFQVLLLLDEGPNLIEVLASDYILSQVWLNFVVVLETDQ